MQQSGIGGDDVARLEFYDVAGHEARCLHDRAAAAADDTCRGGVESVEGGDGLGGLEILEEADDDVDEDDACEDASFYPRLDGEAGCEGEEENLVGISTGVSERKTGYLPLSLR